MWLASRKIWAWSYLRHSEHGISYLVPAVSSSLPLVLATMFRILQSRPLIPCFQCRSATMPHSGQDPPHSGLDSSLGSIIQCLICKPEAGPLWYLAFLLCETFSPLSHPFATSQGPLTSLWPSARFDYISPHHLWSTQLLISRSSSSEKHRALTPRTSVRPHPSIQPEAATNQCFSHSPNSSPPLSIPSSGFVSASERVCKNCRSPLLFRALLAFESRGLSSKPRPS